MEYGVHPTRYKILSDDQLYSMYRVSNYGELKEDEKLELVQETVNRDALERGEIGAPEVRFVDLPVNESGNSINGIININRDMAVYGVQNYEYKGKCLNHNIADYNMQTLNTAIHENIHCFQEQVIDETIDIGNVNLKREYQANEFTCTPVVINGKAQIGCQYLVGESALGYYMYYFQATERDAYLNAEEKTDRIINQLIQKYGSEESFDEYKKSLKINGYYARESEAIKLFNNVNIVKDINYVLQNQYYGTKASVDQRTEMIVKAEMIASYNFLTSDISTNVEGKNMSFNPKPVSLEEYNQTLRDSVNAYYNSEINNPNVSNEEAVQSTNEMSERYIETVQEFQNEQLQGNEITSGYDVSEIDDGGIEDDGLSF